LADAFNFKQSTLRKNNIVSASKDGFDSMDEDDRTKDVDILLGNPKKAITAMAIPTMVALIAQSANNLIDAMWVSGLGSTQMAAVGFVFAIFFIMIGVGNGIGIGAASLIAKYIGNDDKERADSAATHSIVLILIASAILTIILLVTAKPLLTIISSPDALDACLEYAYPIILMTAVFLMMGVMSSVLRAEGAAKRSMYILILAAAINIVISPFFIYDYGFGMGLAGAAWSTVLAESVALIVMIYWYFVKKDLFLKFRFRGFRFDGLIVRRTFRVGLPAASEFFIISAVIVIMNLILTKAGGIDAVAIYSSDWRIIQVLMIPLMGISMAVIPVCAAAYGARRNDDIREAYFYSLKIAVAAMLVIAAATALFAGYITMMFTYGEGSAHLHDGLTEFLRIACLFLPFLALGSVSSSLFLSLGMGVRSLISTLFRNTILIPMAYLAMTHGSLTTIWWATTAGEIIGCAVVGLWCFATLRALMKGRRISRTEPM